MVAGLRHAARAELLAVLRGKDDVDRAQFAELVEDAAWFVAQARPLAQLAEELPEHVGQEADQDMGQDAVLFLVPHGPERQVAFLDAERRLRLGQLDVRAP